MDYKIIGDYMLNLEENKNTLHIRFSSHDFFKSWERCSLTSNFSSDYMIFSNIKEDNKIIANSLSFIINELLENAIKNSPKDKNNDRDRIDLTLVDKGKEIILEIDNLMEKENYLILKDIAEDLQENELNEKKLKDTIQEIAQSLKNSGMGLLMIINYFKIKMGFKFSGPENGFYHTSIQASLQKEALLQ